MAGMRLTGSFGSTREDRPVQFLANTATDTRLLRQQFLVLPPVPV